MIRFHYLWLFLLILSCGENCPLSAQQSEIVATVDDQPVTINEVHYFLDRTLKNLSKQSDRDSRSDAVIALGINHCIKRAVVLAHLRNGKFKTAKQEIGFQIEALTAELESKGMTLEGHLKEIQLNESELRRELEWLTSWRKYARSYITQEHLKKQFEKNKPRYDGRRIRVAQILWKQADEETTKIAKQIRQKIAAGSLSWADAVKQNSQSASAKDGGDLGWIAFSGPMLPEFNKRVFQLKLNEVSLPFTTQFGTHLVKCTDIKPGERTFEEVIGNVRSDETNRLFELTAAKHREGKKIVKHKTFQ